MTDLEATASSAGVKAAVKVKRLEWRQDWGGSCDDIPEWRASTPWGSIVASVAGYRDDDGKPYQRHADVPNGLRISLLAEAEDRYKAKVLSALVPPAAGGNAEEPVAWRYRGKNWGENYWHYFTKEPSHKEDDEIWQGLYTHPSALKDSGNVGDGGAEINAERQFLASEARRYASHYPEASDGRNTFIMFAEMIEARASTEEAK